MICLIGYKRLILISEKWADRHMLNPLAQQYNCQNL